MPKKPYLCSRKIKDNITTKTQVPEGQIRLMKTTYFNGETIVAFHIGRFYNAGHLTFEGAHEISFYAQNLFSHEDEGEDAEFTDESGNSVGLTMKEYKSGVGSLDMDGEYNTTYTMYLKDVEEDSDEWKAIFKAYGFEAEQAQNFLNPEEDEDED